MTHEKKKETKTNETNKLNRELVNHSCFSKSMVNNNSINDQPCFLRVHDFEFSFNYRESTSSSIDTRDEAQRPTRKIAEQAGPTVDHVAFRTSGRRSQPGKDNTVTPSRRPVENCVHHDSPPNALGAGRPTSPARHDARRRSAPRTTTCTPPTNPPRGSSLPFLSFSAALLPFTRHPIVPLHAAPPLPRDQPRTLPPAPPFSPCNPTLRVDHRLGFFPRRQRGGFVIVSDSGNTVGARVTKVK